MLNILKNVIFVCFVYETWEEHISGESVEYRIGENPKANFRHELQQNRLSRFLNRVGKFLKYFLVSISLLKIHIRYKFGQKRFCCSDTRAGYTDIQIKTWRRFLKTTFLSSGYPKTDISTENSKYCFCTILSLSIPLYRVGQGSISTCNMILWR